MLPWAVLGLFILFLIVCYIMVQGTRSALAWRDAAEKGDLGVIRDIMEDSIKHWSSMRKPKTTAAEVWRGIQSMQLAVVAPEYVGVTCVAASDYKMQDGRWIEMRNPLQEGIAITARASEMLMYEVIHYRPETIQIDVYTDYRDDVGVTDRQCILSTLATHDAVRAVDWDNWTPEQIVDSFETRYRLSDAGRPLPVEPFTPPEVPEAEPATQIAEATS
ncbi:MAG: hypothetical protein ABI559_03100 [Chloroflexota bacterium]